MFYDYMIDKKMWWYNILQADMLLELINYREEIIKQNHLE